MLTALMRRFTDCDPEGAEALGRRLQQDPEDRAERGEAPADTHKRVMRRLGGAGALLLLLSSAPANRLLQPDQVLRHGEAGAWGVWSVRVRRERLTQGSVTQTASGFPHELSAAKINSDIFLSCSLC